jgi:septal ring factor EnvC (AmiA/AmiB activator)
LKVSRSIYRPLLLWFPCVFLLHVILTVPGATDGENTEASDERLAAEEAKLELLSEKLTSLRSELGSLDQRQTTLLGELHKLEIQIRLSREELELMKLQLERGYREIDNLLKRIQALENSIQELRPFLADRSVSLYKLGRLSYVRLLLSIEEPQDLTRAYRYISRLAHADGEKIGRFITDQRALEESKSELVVRTKDMLEVRNQLEATTQTLERRRATKETLLSEIHERREMAETLMYELEDARGKLGEFMTRLVRGELVEEDAAFLPIRLFRGELEWPVDGKVSTHFGKQYHPRFRTVTMQNGIEIEASLSAPVGAVYDGHVVFASWFQGYGKLLIIGHPGNVHSLYGHLSDIKVKKGDIVHRGEEVAWVGDTGSLSGPSLYFEIRDDGEPVDPAEWLLSSSKSNSRTVTESS